MPEPTAIPGQETEAQKLLPRSQFLAPTVGAVAK